MYLYPFHFFFVNPSYSWWRYTEIHITRATYFLLFFFYRNKGDVYNVNYYKYSIGTYNIMYMVKRKKDSGGGGRYNNALDKKKKNGLRPKKPIRLDSERSSLYS